MINFIFYVSPDTTLASWHPEAVAHYSLGDAAILSGVHPEMLRYYCRLGLLGTGRTDAGGHLLFDEDALREVRRIEYYRRYLGVNRRALPLLCELRREGRRLQLELRFLEVN